MTSETDVLIVTVTEVESRVVMKAFKEKSDRKATPDMPLASTRFSRFERLVSLKSHSPC
ncbi:MAG: hypothetical protein AB4290_24775 [Spirulina sp.]